MAGRLPPRWHVLPADPRAQSLAAALGLRRPTAQVLLNRGLDNVEAARAFLRADLASLRDPWCLPDLPRAVDRLCRAVARQEPLVIYGDYDADGQTATALLVALFTALGLPVRFFIPRRHQEGYGLHAGALAELLQHDTRLVLAVDCGVTAAAEAAWLREQGVDLLVVDHHEVPAELPDALAVVDPKRRDSRYGFTGLAACGLAYKLACALVQALGPRGERARPVLEEGLQLVALGTVADVVPLVDENRALVRAGLARLASSPQPGLRALLEATGLMGRELTTEHLGFILAPRLNAAGRMADARVGVELLLAPDAERAAALVRQLEAHNRDRQGAEAQVLEEAEEWLATHADPESDGAIVVAGSGWHPGVVGIVAARLVEAYHRPAVVLGVDGEMAVGSARSVRGFDLYQGLAAVSHLLERFGGHEQAAGLTLRADRVPLFRERFQEVVREWLSREGWQPSITIDTWVTAPELDLLLVAELEALAPFGNGNPPPTLALRRLALEECQAMGRTGGHLRLTALDPETGRRFEAVGWRLAAGLLPRLADAPAVDLAFVPEANEWEGTRRLRLRLVDAIPSPRERVQLRVGAVGETVAVPGTGGRWQVVDERGALDGAPAARRLAELLAQRSGSGRWSLVFGADQLEIDPAEVRRWLAIYGPSSAGEDVVWVAEASWSSEAPLGQEAGGSGPVDLWLCGLPPSVGHLARLLRSISELAPGERRCHLCYSPQSLARVERRLQCRYPDIDILRRIWLLVRQRLEEGPAPLRPEALAAPDKGWDADGVRWALAIFAELGLLLRTGAASWQLGVVPERKLDLRLAMTYNKGIVIKREFASLRRLALANSGADLLRAALVGPAGGAPGERGQDHGLAQPGAGDTRFSAAGRPV